LGLRNSGKLILIKTGPDNKPLFEKELATPEISVQVNSFIRGGLNQLILLLSYEQHQTLHWINTSNGEIVTSSRIPFGIRANGIVTDRKSNLLMLACNGEIILIKNNGTVF
jgi:hypothetical protein